MIFFLRNTYLDHNATTPVIAEVRDAMMAVLRDNPGNPSSLHIAGRAARGVVESARVSIAELLGCDPAEVLFTSGGTEANNAAIKGVFGAHGKGHVVVSAIEHDSVMGACKQVEERGGEVSYVPAGHDGRVRVQDIEAAIRGDTVLVSVMHANNETGAIQPVAEIAKLAHSRGAAMHVDAVQSFGKIPVHPGELGCDLLSISAHKINGPKGCGALVWNGKAGWHPLVFGGDQERALRAGTEGVANIAGFGVAARLAGKRMASEHPRLAALRSVLLDGLRRRVPDLVVHEAPPEFQLPGTLNLAFPGKEGVRLLAGLDCYEVAVSIGSACTADRVEPSHVLLGMGISEREALSSIRISMGTTTTERDIKYTLRVMDEVLQGDPAGFSYMPPEHLTPERLGSPGVCVVDLRIPTDRLVQPSIAGARVLSFMQMDRWVKELPRDKEVVFICGTGMLSLTAGYRLANSGHSNVKVVYGGYKAWSGLGRG